MGEYKLKTINKSKYSNKQHSISNKISRKTAFSKVTVVVRAVFGVLCSVPTVGLM